MEQIEKKLEDLIGESGNDELMSAWLDFLEEKNKRNSRIEAKIDKKDPIIIGALLGAFIGSLFSEENTK